MTRVMGEKEASDIGLNHELNDPNPENETIMDLWNNEQGRACRGDCGLACEGKLITGQLRVLPSEDSDEAPVPSSPQFMIQPDSPKTYGPYNRPSPNPFNPERFSPGHGPW